MKNKNAVELGRLGGLARARTLTPSELSEIARHAGRLGGAAGKGKKKPRRKVKNNP